VRERVSSVRVPESKYILQWSAIWARARPIAIALFHVYFAILGVHYYYYYYYYYYYFLYPYIYIPYAIAFAFAPSP
jgi:hypothetical protein